MKTFMVPWKAWYGDEELTIAFPDKWNTQICYMKDAPAVSDDGLRKAFSMPIGTKSIKEMAKHKKTAAIVVDDMTRSTKAHLLLPALLNHLKQGGIHERSVRIIVARGSHRFLVMEDLRKKVGDAIINNIEVTNHRPLDNLINLGFSKKGKPIWINESFIESDLRIGVGSIVPHDRAGFSGGGKIVMPGIAGLETVIRTHEDSADSVGGLAMLDSNPFRSNIEEIAQKAGLNFIVSVVVNSNRDIAGVFVGDFIKAHRQAATFAGFVYSTVAPVGADIGVFNAYPRDTELYKSVEALHVYLSSGREVEKEGGTIVLIAACVEGIGYSSLSYFGKEPFINPDHIRNRRLILFSPNMSSVSVHGLLPERTLVFDNWEDLIEELMKSYKSKCSVAIFPYAGIQLVTDQVS